MIGLLGRQGAAATLGQHCTQMTQRPGKRILAQSFPSLYTLPDAHHVIQSLTRPILGWREIAADHISSEVKSNTTMRRTEMMPMPKGGKERCRAHPLRGSERETYLGCVSPSSCPSLSFQQSPVAVSVKSVRRLGVEWAMFSHSCFELQITH